MNERRRHEKHLELSYLIGRYVTDHLLRVNRVFEGDLTAALVLATIAQRNMQRFYDDVARRSERGLDRLVEADEHLPHLRACNALSVSDATGIPRETVRRKVKWLIAKGWVTAGERGRLAIARRIGKQFEEFDRESIARFEDTARQVLAVIDGPGRSE
ncbi:MAG TPA: hypothetical protein VFP48_11630 [Steroidobacteraceae bacterium]|nr:hypothetical protein [Steroidobacteraceae bacterium]